VVGTGTTKWAGEEEAGDDGTRDDTGSHW
jgi:hypothetical protein